MIWLLCYECRAKLGIRFEIQAIESTWSRLGELFAFVKGDLYRCSWCAFRSAKRNTIAIAKKKAALNQLPAWNASSKESPKKSVNTAKLLPSLNLLIYSLPTLRFSFFDTPSLYACDR